MKRKYLITGEYIEKNHYADDGICNYIVIDDAILTEEIVCRIQKHLIKKYNYSKLCIVNIIPLESVEDD